MLCDKGDNQMDRRDFMKKGVVAAAAVGGAVALGGIGVASDESSDYDFLQAFCDREEVRFEGIMHGLISFEVKAVDPESDFESSSWHEGGMYTSSMAIPYKEMKLIGRDETESLMLDLLNSAIKWLIEDDKEIIRYKKFYYRVGTPLENIPYYKWVRD